MARQRKPEHSSVSKKSGSGGSSASDTDVAPRSKCMEYWRYFLGASVLIVAIVVGYVGYLETRVNTPFKDKKVVVKSSLESPELYWGTYRPGHYLGLKTRDYHSPVMGLMWYTKLKHNGEGIRHWYNQDDRLAGTTWLHHDGKNFGEQVILDIPHNINTTIVKRPYPPFGGDWTVRISVHPLHGVPPTQQMSIVWYVALDTTAPPHELAESYLRLGTSQNDDGYIYLDKTESKLPLILGSAPALGPFRIKFKSTHKSCNATVNYSYTACMQGGGGLAKLHETFTSSLRYAVNSGNGEKIIVLDKEQEAGSNFIAVQVVGRPPLTIDVIYESLSVETRTEELSEERMSDAMAENRRQFEERFERTFHLKKKGYAGDDIFFAKAALSSLIGGIGYFYGAGRVKSSYTKEPVPYWKAPLYTAVPSRSKFPRGFLWDEGFHAALIGRWDREIYYEIVSHWLDLMNVEGWIPREQILGPEALERVPEEFVTQHNTNANPPMLLITMSNLLVGREDKLDADEVETLKRMYSRLQAWYDWFNTTQSGSMPTSFRWRGRNETTDKELNPITLTSGLDDYPRASHPSEFERHVDLRCWMFAAADSLARIAHAIGKDPSSYYEIRDQLGDQRLLDELHWSPFTESYSDFGLHTDGVKLGRPPAPKTKQGQHNMQQPKQDLVRITTDKPRYRFVDTTFGYVSLFPVLMKVLKPDSPRLGKVLDDLGKEELLWTSYGLRSLSPTSPLYAKYNTEHSPPYWRGPIWINLNYLALSALYHYKNEEGPQKEKAAQLYERLRKNVVENILKQYLKTGFFWEQYNDKTGAGQSGAPFTGWTTLLVLIMAEQY